MKSIVFSLRLKNLHARFRGWSLRLLLGSVLAVCLIIAGGHPVLGDDTNTLYSVDFEPKIISGDSLDDWTAGISYDVNYRTFGLYNISLGQADAMLEARLSGTLALDSDLNKETLISEALVGASLLTGEAGEDPLTPGQDLKKDLGRAADYNSRGYFFVGTDLRHETDQEFEEQHLAIGVETGYINPKDEDIYSFIPSVIVAFEWIDPFQSQIRDNLSADKSGFSRFRIEASLKSSFGRKLFAGTWIEPLGLRFDYRYFVSNDLDGALEAADQDEITYFAAALTYTRKKQIGYLGHQTFFVKISDGRLPPATEDETIVTLGVIMPLGGILK